MKNVKKLKSINVTIIANLFFALLFLACANPVYPFGQSPIITKFVTTLPGLGPSAANTNLVNQTKFGQYIPLAKNTPGMFRDVLTDKYFLGVTEFTEKMHPDLPNATHLWGYYDLLNPDHKYLGGVIVAKRGTPVLLSLRNELPNHEIIPIDPTVSAGSKMDGTPLTVGDLPLNRAVTHVHGGFTPWISDGTPFQWFSPTGLTGESFRNVPGTNPRVDSATYYYPMDQSARLLWYHDHAMGITRTNAYSGIASALVLTDDFESYLLDPNNKLVPDLVGIPLIIQDKTFLNPVTDPKYPVVGAKTGDLWYPWDYEANVLSGGIVNPNGRWDWGLTVSPPSAGQGVKSSLPPVSLVPEFFADTAIVNGAPYPVVNVTGGTFRFRILNASQARFWHLSLYEEDPAHPGEVIMDNDPGTGKPAVFVVDAHGKIVLNPSVKPGPTMYQIATEGGFLPDVAPHYNTTPIPLDLIADPSGNTAIPTGPFNLLVAPAERADVLIDFTGKQGKTYLLYNDAPAPFPMGEPRNDYFTGNPDFTVPTIENGGLGGGAPSTIEKKGPNTRTIMKIVVGLGTNGFELTPAKLKALSTALKQNFKGGNPVAPQQPPLLYAGSDKAKPGKLPYTGPVTRMLTLNEDFDEFGRLIQTLGTVDPQGNNNQGLPTWGIPYMMPPTETTAVGSTEVWQIANLTGDTHPIHIHLVNAQLIQRQDFTFDPLQPNISITPVPGTVTGPDPDEIGWKETIRMNPSQITTVIMKFDLPKVPFTVLPSIRDGINYGNEYVWHCHILEHEEHDMMRPLVVTGPPPLAAFPVTQTAAKVLGVNYSIYNGVPPYTITSDSKLFPPVPAKIGFSGGGFFVPTAQSLFIKNPSTVKFTITDNKGTKEVVTLNLKY
jgi:spore coat protein A, manganese oxidase